jgi:hypothetical protein
VCGNGICEAGEGRTSFNNTIMCDQDCNSSAPYALCDQVPENAKQKCVECAANVNGIWTAVGCIKTNESTIFKTIITIGLSLAGGLGLIRILVAAFIFSTSQGNPQQVSKAKETLTSTVIGIIFIVFSVTILQFISIGLLKIPGFGQ